jgi:hypothetical protein
VSSGKEVTICHKIVTSSSNVWLHGTHAMFGEKGLKSKYATRLGPG